MTKKLVLTLLAVFTLFSATVALADGGTRIVELEDGTTASLFTDERINAFDLAAPVAVYRMATTVPVIGEDGLPVWTATDDLWFQEFEDVFAGYEFWGVIDADGNIQKVFELTAAQITDANAAGVPVSVSNAGYSVQYDPASGWLWLTASNGYSFAWEL